MCPWLAGIFFSSEIKTSENRETRLRDFPPSEALGEVDIYLFWGIMCLSLIPVTLITATIKVSSIGGFKLSE